MKNFETDLPLAVVAAPTLLFILLAAVGSIIVDHDATLLIVSSVFIPLPFAAAMTFSVFREVSEVSVARRNGGSRPIFRLIPVLFIDFLPIVFLVCLGLYFSFMIENETTREVYAVKKVTLVKNRALSCRAEHLVCKSAENSLADNLADTMDIIEPQINGYIQDKVSSALSEAHRKPVDPIGLPKLFFGDENGQGALLPNDIFKLPPRCSLWRWLSKPAKCIERRLLEPVQIAWHGLRNDLQRDLNAGLKDTARKKADLLTDIETRFSENVRSTTATGVEASTAAIRITSAVWTIIDIFLLVTLVFGVVKLFLIILARRLFDIRADRNSMRLSAYPANCNQPIEAYDITRPLAGKNGFEHSWDASSEEREVLYVRFPKGVVRRGTFGDSWPYSLGAPLRRLGSLALTLTAFQPNEERASKKFNSDNSVRFVEVTLKKGQRISFHFSDLVTVTNGVRFKTVLSLRLGSFLRHQNLYTIAEGTGKIVLRASGAQTTLFPDTSKQNLSDLSSMPVNQLAFDFDGLFYSDTIGQSNHTAAIIVRLIRRWVRLYFQSGNVFMGGPVAPAGQTRLVEHAPPRGLRRTFSTVRRLLFFVLPI